MSKRKKQAKKTQNEVEDLYENYEPHRPVHRRPIYQRPLGARPLERRQLRNDYESRRILPRRDRNMLLRVK